MTSTTNEMLTALTETHEHRNKGRECVYETVVNSSHVVLLDF
jgi:hypothetical protein